MRLRAQGLEIPERLHTDRIESRSGRGGKALKIVKPLSGAWRREDRINTTQNRISDRTGSTRSNTS